MTKGIGFSSPPPKEARPFSWVADTFRMILPLIIAGSALAIGYYFLG